MTTIALTGVTGNLGGYVAQHLSAAGVEARHLARSPERAPKLPHATVYQAAFENTPQVVAALQGVDVLFMVSAKEHPQRLAQHLAFVDAARTAGVRHIIYTSFYNASPDSVFTLGRDHAATEAHIRAGGFTYTFLRDNFYTDFFAELAQEYHELKGPAGNGKVSAVVRSDVAEVAAAVLRDTQQWENQVLNMTGPEDLTLTEIAAIATEVLGTPVQYVEETVDEAYESRKAWPAEQWEYDSWVSTYTAIAAGEQSGVSGDIERVLGRKPQSVRTDSTAEP